MTSNIFIEHFNWIRLCPGSHLEGDLLDLVQMRDERATRVALAISWWKMQGVLASSRWPRRSAQASTCRSRKLASIVISSLIEHLRSRLDT